MAGVGDFYLHTGKNDLSRAAFEEAAHLDPSRKEQLAAVIAKLNSLE